MIKTVKIKADLGKRARFNGVILPPPRSIAPIEKKVESYISDNNITNIISIQYTEDELYCYLTYDEI